MLLKRVWWGQVFPRKWYLSRNEQKEGSCQVSVQRKLFQPRLFESSNEALGLELLGGGLGNIKKPMWLGTVGVNKGEWMIREVTNLHRNMLEGS